jgi:phenylacetate-coenzyme A ligase PaaK-like adenylate-forming protein
LKGWDRVRLPEWTVGRRFEPGAVISVADLKALPLLARADVRDHLDEIPIIHRLENLVPARTCGSTGMALYVCCDRYGVEERQGAALLAVSGRRPKTTHLGAWTLAFSIGKG